MICKKKKKMLFTFILLEQGFMISSKTAIFNTIKVTILVNSEGLKGPKVAAVVLRHKYDLQRILTVMCIYASYKCFDLHCESNLAQLNHATHPVLSPNPMGTQLFPRNIDICWGCGMNNMHRIVWTLQSVNNMSKRFSVYEVTDHIFGHESDIADREWKWRGVWSWTRRHIWWRQPISHRCSKSIFKRDALQEMLFKSNKGDLSWSSIPNNNHTAPTENIIRMTRAYLFKTSRQHLSCSYHHLMYEMKKTKGIKVFGNSWVEINKKTHLDADIGLLLLAGV